MRRISIVMAWGSLIAIALQACADSYGSDDPRPAAPSDSGPGASASDASTALADTSAPPVDAGADAFEGGALPCPGARYVDGFEDTDPLTPFWTRSTTTAGGTISVEQDGGASSGIGVLRATAPSAVGSGRSAYLTLDRGRLPVGFTFCLSFTIQVPAPTIGSVTGPRILATDGNANASLLLSVNGRSLYLGQFVDACPSDGGSSCRVDEIDLLTTLTEPWTQIRIEGELRSAQAPFGDVRVTIGSAALQVIPLRANLLGYASGSLRFGLTNAGDNESGSFRFDDVVYRDSLP